MANVHTHSHEKGCCSGHSVCAPSTQQTLNELDFERGIWNAAVNGDTQEILKKINKGLDINMKDSSGYSALHYACRNGHYESVELLVHNGADVNIETHSGATPLHRAAYMGHTRIVELLLRRGANALLCDSDGMTALHKASEKGNIEVCKLIVSKCPQARKIQDKKGRQPKDLTSESEIKFLLDAC